MRIDPKPKTPDLREDERLRDRQDAAEFHFESYELEYGPLSRDPHFDERFDPIDD